MNCFVPALAGSSPGVNSQRGRAVSCGVVRPRVEFRHSGRVRMAASVLDIETEVESPEGVEVKEELVFEPVKNPLRKLLRSTRFFFAIRGRVKKGSVLCMTVSGALPDQRPMTSLFSQPPESPSLPELTTNLIHAAHDPRISAVYLKIEPLACGYAKLEEVRRHMEFFRQSGKKLVAYTQLGGVKEYFLSLSADEVFVPPEAILSLRGFNAAGTFVRGVLEKIGVEPQVQRIGEYKSAGDQLARTSMSEAQREVLNSIMEQQYDRFIHDVAKVRKKSEDDVKAILDAAPQLMEEYKEGGWVTDIMYESTLVDKLKEEFNKGRTTEAKLKRPLRSVGWRKYTRVRAKTLALQGKSCIAVIRACGAITLGKNGSNPVTGGTCGSDSFIETVRTAIDSDFVKAVVIRVDSPGGVSLAADVMWNELKALAKKKPVIASMADVAASGGYYLAMACDTIVAEELTLTGSIGVVSAKLSLKDLFDRIGFVRENISIGKYAELEVDNRPFTEAEEDYFAQGAQYAYKSFVSKAAESRGMTYDEMNKLARGRVWTGLQAKERGLVDEIGGLNLAINLAKEKANIKDAGRIVELRSRRGFGGLLGLFRSSTANPAGVAAMSLGELGKPEMLLMTDYDGSDVNPVQRHLAGRVFNSAVNFLDIQSLRQLLSMTFRS
ncbi:hypothetical protein NDN08_003923 [Rhodosorus marinus]|uniref:Peptidase S49 domain-containing protein n=1 Tax=Rhodosorus marinus TaxID=101924 RepID=A0AAV8UKK4_9RHOD|nr:hypothetical protein NDN08_003923 [Rhodosorus marinus]